MSDEALDNDPYMVLRRVLDRVEAENCVLRAALRSAQESCDAMQMTAIEAQIATGSQLMSAYHGGRADAYRAAADIILNAADAALSGAQGRDGEDV